MTSIKNINAKNDQLMKTQNEQQIISNENSNQSLEKITIKSPKTNHIKLTLDEYIPIQLATKYYSKWDCDIQLKQTQKGYFKCLQGKGTIQFSNGNIFKGQLYNGLMHGKNCQFIWNTGIKYKGDFKLNSITGNGIFTWLDGSSYQGQLLQGKRHGKGDYYCEKDKSKYYGQFKNGVKHGFGLMQFNQQTSYQGFFCQGLRHGKGKMKYQSGNVYQGDWINDKKQGYGVMNWFTQNQKYQGEWKNDVQHGLGSYYWFDGKIQYKIIKNIYKGHWQNGQRNGYGSFFFSNGCKYQGYFTNSCKDGFGLVMDQWGNVKLEYFQKNKLIYSVPNGGSMENNQKKLVGNGVQTNSKGLNGQNIIDEKSNMANMVNIKSSRVNNTNTKVLPLLKKSNSNAKITGKLNPISNSKVTNSNNKNPNQSMISGVNANDNLDSSIIETSQQQHQNSITNNTNNNNNNNNNNNIKKPTTLLPSSMITNNNCDKQNTNPIQQNFYSKCLDVAIYNNNNHSTSTQTQPKSSFNSLNKIPNICKIDLAIMNLLLRQNSKLKSWYKQCCTFNTNTNNITNNGINNNKDNFYTGLIMENLWKLLKDIKILDQFITIPKLNRQFSKGWKSMFQIILPNQKKVELMSKYLQNIKDQVKNNQICQVNTLRKLDVNNQTVNYTNIQWACYYQDLMSNDDMKLSINEKQIDLNPINDIHNPKKIILFRHFVTYLLKVAFLQTQKSISISNSKVQLNEEGFLKEYKLHIQKLFKIIETYHDSSFRDSRTFSDNMSYVSKQRTPANVSQDYSKINQQLFNQLTKNQQNFAQNIDKTIKVRTLFQLLEKFSILKQVNQKMLFLQKIQRIFQSQFKQAGSLFKKQMKHHFVNLQKIIHISPLFNRILSYNLVFKDFEDLLYLAVNKRIHSSNRDDAIKKYKEIIDGVKDYVKICNQTGYLKENSNNDHNNNKSSKSTTQPSITHQKKKKPSSILTPKFIVTQKDILREQLLKKHEQQTRLKKQAEQKMLQAEKQLKQRVRMERQDFRWEEKQQESQNQSDDFFQD